MEGEEKGKMCEREITAIRRLTAIGRLLGVKWKEEIMKIYLV